MNSVDGFLNQSAEWLRGSGPLNDIVLSSRLRLARNIKGYPFLQKLNTGQKKSW